MRNSLLPLSGKLSKLFDYQLIICLPFALCPSLFVLCLLLFLGFHLGEEDDVLNRIRISHDHRKSVHTNP